MSDKTAQEIFLLLEEFNNRIKQSSSGKMPEIYVAGLVYGFLMGKGLPDDICCQTQMRYMQAITSIPEVVSHSNGGTLILNKDGSKFEESKSLLN